MCHGAGDRFDNDVDTDPEVLQVCIEMVRNVMKVVWKYVSPSGAN